jgi:bifunctional non-homologous end joining protein LigD
MGRPARSRRAAAPRFVIQEHHARSLHWDLRLEHNGVLASWALPKGLPETPERNHLAVHTEDHPMEYLSFEAEIPKGEYGAGSMTIWDSGHFESEKWTEREVKFDLHGTRASGSYVLFQTDGSNWMIHRHGNSARTDPLPTSIRPMLAVQGTLPKNDASWAYEVKWDGARAIVYSDGGRVTVRSRNDRDATATFPELAELGEFLGMSPLILDGEIVALGEDGRPSFARLQNRLHIGDAREARRRANNDPITFVAFDVLYADGRSLMGAPYDQRRARLEALHLSGKHFITAESFRDTPGRDVLQATVANGLEGVVAKRRDSVYRPGRRVTEWVKVKTVQTQDVVIGGWTEGKGERRASLGALLMGIPGHDGLHFAGKVGTGFKERDRKELLEALTPLAVRSSPFVNAVPAADAKVAHYVRPELVGEVAYGEWTPAGRLRHPRWIRLRSDKGANEVSRETEADAGEQDAAGDDRDALPATRQRPSASSGSRPTRVRVDDKEVPVTNLDKVLFPDTGFTKGELIDYYARIAPAVLPHVADRPLTMKRYPDGVTGKFFFEKHVPSHAPRWVQTATVTSERQGEITYAVVGDLPSLVWAANLGAIEFHVPLWRVGRRRRLPANPDLMVFDLDPGEGTDIVQCCEVALLVMDALSGKGRGEAYAKTSGMKGLQLYYAVAPRTRWETVRNEAHDIARQLESEHRDLVVSTMRKDLRRGHVLIDWSQNHPAKTTVAVYSVRAAPFPSVSTPVTLAEVKACAARGDPTLLRFDTEAVLARVAKRGDLFAGLDRG